MKYPIRPWVNLPRMTYPISLLNLQLNGTLLCRGEQYRPGPTAASSSRERREDAAAEEARTGDASGLGCRIRCPPRPGGIAGPRAEGCCCSGACCRSGECGCEDGPRGMAWQTSSFTL
jgi:hypothetical protein